MGSENLLKNLGVRLTYLGQGSNEELDALLGKIRCSLKQHSFEDDVRQQIDELTRLLMIKDNNPANINGSAGSLVDEFTGLLLTLPLEKSYSNKIKTLVEQFTQEKDYQTQVGYLREIFNQIHLAVRQPSQSKSSGFGWFDKKSRKIDESWLSFFDKTSLLLDQILTHIDVLHGSASETMALREQLDNLKQNRDTNSLELVLEDTLLLLGAITQKMRDERISTQAFLGELREKLHSVEGVIYSLITDGDDSLDRASVLEKKVSDDVLVIGKAVEEDELLTLKKTVEQRLAKLSANVSDYLVTEREHHQNNQKKVKDLNRKVREMELEATKLRSELKNKQDMALKDTLTGVYNRAGYLARVEEEFARIQRINSPLSIVFVDCNKFKHINDTFGHKAGDIVLKKVAEALASRARKSDIVSRYGGDEFVVLLPDTHIEGAEIFARDACEVILKAGFNNNGERLDISISCGVTQARKDDTHESVLHRADEAMYQAKALQGIRVSVLP